MLKLVAIFNVMALPLMVFAMCCRIPALGSFVDWRIGCRTDWGDDLLFYQSVKCFTVRHSEVSKDPLWPALKVALIGVILEIVRLWTLRSF